MGLRLMQCLASLLAAVLALPWPVRAFETPLSDTAVRQAYFIGQRRDESYGHFLASYYKHFPPPKTGPYISSVAFLTPYALLAQFSNQQLPGYNAQQAERDHRRMVETVKILIEIQLTDTYPAVIPNPTGQTSGTPWDRIQRPSDFWRDFRIQVISDNKVLSPLIARGEPNYICDSDLEGLAPGEWCTLMGATVHLEFLADQFAPDSATIEINPPENDQILVDFDLSRIR
jgi:hypothetical protein